MTWDWDALTLDEQDELRREFPPKRRCVCSYVDLSLAGCECGAKVWPADDTDTDEEEE